MKITYGPIVGAMSGGLGSVVATRGRYGPVLRIGVIPTLRTTTQTTVVRGRLTQLSKQWASLDAQSRASWVTWAGQTPIVDRLGASRTLSGNAAFIRCNSRILACLGTVITHPKVSAAPAPISGVTVTAAQVDTIALNWTSGALAATECIMVWAAVVESSGREFYKNLLKLVQVSAGAEETPLAIGTAVTNRFGWVKANQRLYVHAFVCDNTTGLVSSLAMANCIVTAP
jgi:hypothetical protein